ncbi:MAG: polyhydroxyalkanoic acid system family protein [Planctomycetes bacterium]|nr:polyhydroxyalkanoic acid system family protein [Planctomycetota bacterium]
MPNFNMEVSHGLGREVAIERLKGFMDKVRRRDDVSDLQESWEGSVQTFSFKTYGFKVEGAATVEEDRVKMDGKLPLAAAPFRGKIEGSIREELEKVLQE